MDKRMKQTAALIAFGVTLYAALSNLSTVISGVKTGLQMLLPVVLGMLLAFMLSVPCRGVEKLLRKLPRGRKELGEGALTGISVLLTLVCLLLVTALLVVLLAPELVRSVQSIVALVEQNWPRWEATLRELGFNVELLHGWIDQLDLGQMLSRVVNEAGALIGSVAGAAATVVSGLTSVLIACIVAVYMLLSRKTLARQVKRLLYAAVREKTADRVCHAASLINKTYAKFLSGQFVEALLLGAMILVAFAVFGLPYAGLAGVLAAFCSFIPYIGAFLSCAVTVFLALLVSPKLALIALVVYLVVQFVETQLIYPHVVGSSVGLSPLWTLVAVLVGGKLFGLAGMIFFIPLTAACFQLLREWVGKRLEEKGINPQSRGQASDEQET